MKLIWILLFVFLTLYPFGQLTRLPFGLVGLHLGEQFPEIHLYLTDVVLALLLTVWIIRRIWLVKRKYRFPPLGKPIIIFWGIAFLSLFFNFSNLPRWEVMIAGLYLLRLAVYFGFYFLIYDFRRKKKIIDFLMVSGVMMGVWGLVQYLLWPDIGSFSFWGWDPHYYRVVGTFLDPNFSGIIYVLTLILLTIQNWEKIFQLRTKGVVFYGSFLLVYLALALTYSRSSYLAYLVAMMVIAVVKKNFKLFLVGFLVGFLTILVLPRSSGGEGVYLKRTASVYSRFHNWQQALLISREHPFLGVGFNAYRYVQQSYGFLTDGWRASHAGAGADSSFLFVLATTGCLGVFAYIYFWLKIFFLAKRKLRLNSKDGLAIIILATAAALLVHSCFVNSLFHPWVLAWWMIILALQ